LRPRSNPSARLIRLGAALAAVPLLLSCSGGNPVDRGPATVAPATPAASPPVTGDPAGTVRALDLSARAALFDPGTDTLVVLGTVPAVALLPSTPGVAPRTVALPAEATAICGDGAGTVYLATRGGYLRMNLSGPAEQVAAEKVEVDGHQDTEFTAIARHDDGRLVLGSADGGVYTLDSDTTVGGEVTSFVRVDALVTQGGDTVVLDRAQSLVTTVDNSGRNPRHALRAGDGATTLATDPAGRVLVADTRGGELLVFSVDPLLMRQRYPVPDSPYGLAGSRSLTWVSQTATNTVIGYDLATGIPVERIRYRTVQQPNALAFDDASGTLYVVSGSGAGVQIISDAVVSG
jgi:outer membrane protein assembly factor BamB